MGGAKMKGTQYAKLKVNEQNRGHEQNRGQITVSSNIRETGRETGNWCQNTDFSYIRANCVLTLFFLFFYNF
jgi:hypothetical protein